MGRARAKITPEESGWLGGYGHRNRPAEGIAADLWARALALENKLGRRHVLVNADIHIFTRRLHREIVEAARNRLGLEQSEVMLIATHTHNGPALPEGFDPIISWGGKMHSVSGSDHPGRVDSISTGCRTGTRTRIPSARQRR